MKFTKLTPLLFLLTGCMPAPYLDFCTDSYCYYGEYRQRNAPPKYMSINSPRPIQIPQLEGDHLQPATVQPAATSLPQINIQINNNIDTAKKKITTRKEVVYDPNTDCDSAYCLANGAGSQKTE